MGWASRAASSTRRSRATRSSRSARRSRFTSGEHPLVATALRGRLPALALARQQLQSDGYLSRARGHYGHGKDRSALQSVAYVVVVSFRKRMHRMPGIISLEGREGEVVRVFFFYISFILFSSKK